MNITGQSSLEKKAKIKKKTTFDDFGKTWQKWAINLSKRKS